MFSVFPPSKKQYLCKTKYNFVYPYWPVVSRFVNGVLGLPAGISLWSSKVIRQLLSPFISMLLRTSHNAVSIRFIHWLIFFIMRMPMFLHEMIVAFLYILTLFVWFYVGGLARKFCIFFLKTGSGFPEFHISLKRNKTFLKQ